MRRQRTTTRKTKGAARRSARIHFFKMREHLRTWETNRPVMRIEHAALLRDSSFHVSPSCSATHPLATTCCVSNDANPCQFRTDCANRDGSARALWHGLALISRRLRPVKRGDETMTHCQLNAHSHAASGVRRLLPTDHRPGSSYLGARENRPMINVPVPSCVSPLCPLLRFSPLAFLLVGPLAVAL